MRLLVRMAMLCNRLHGLVRANKWNGMEARVMDHADGRLVVAIDDGLETQVRVKHANVKLLCRLKVVESSRPPLHDEPVCAATSGPDRCACILPEASASEGCWSDFSGGLTGSFECAAALGWTQRRRGRSKLRQNRTRQHLTTQGYPG